MGTPQVNVTDSGRADFGRQSFTATHDLHRHDLFSDAALIELLDRFPRQHLYAYTMGRDPMRPDENRLALHEGVSGAELLRAVRNGCLWLNVTRIDRADAGYKALIEQLYERLHAQVPGFEPLGCQGTLLISSPQALVYYHADAAASALWHIRGRKRIWIYPALDERYMKRELLEDIFAGVRHEYLPYEHSYDDAAIAYDLEPGDWITWPQNAPHRVTNLDGVNVSLSTEHFTVASRRRARVYIANRFLRTRLRVRNPSEHETGALAFAKTFAHRVANRLGLDPLTYRRYVPAMRIDPDAPGGVVALSHADNIAL
jgi:hypothetical protein